MYDTLKRWTRPDNFADFGDIDRTQYYVAIGQHRDSDTVTRSNFRSMLRELGGESETVLIIRDSHWAVGWVEAIYVHESNTAACAMADETLTALEDYPVISDDDWSGLEYSEACEYWERMSVRDRIDYCRDYRVSIFAARRAELPEDPQGGLVEALTRS